MTRKFKSTNKRSHSQRNWGGKNIYLYVVFVFCDNKTICWRV